MSVIQGSAIESAVGGYQIEQSLRFNSADSAYLSWTPASAGNRKTWTLSWWMKVGSVTGEKGILGVGNVDGSEDVVFLSSQRLRIRYSSGSDNTPAPLLRDVSAWYHVVLSVDTTQATPKNRLRWYVNGQYWDLDSVGYFSDHNAFPTQNFDFRINNNQLHQLGNYPRTGAYFNGYLTEMYFIDGQALTAADFGEYNSDTGVWQPKAYAGTYGTNGFYLNFSDNSALSPTSSVPAMTGHTAPSGTVTYSSEFSATYAAWKGFDSDSTTHWLPSGTTGWLAYEWSSNKTIVYYGVRGWNSSTMSASRAPKNWTFEGWNGSSWVTLDTRINQSSWGDNEIRYYKISSPSAYAKYRINITANNGDGTYLCVATLGLYEQANVIGIGGDYSGNYNNWTPTGFSVTAGTNNDSMVDVPTLYGTDAQNGGEVRGNYATWNPLDRDDGISSVTEGNLKVVTNGSNGSIKSTIAFPSGKWYWEVTSDSISGSGTQVIGIMPQSQPPTNNMSDSGKLGYAIDASFSDRKFENGTATSYGTYTQANGAVYMLAFDQDAGKLWYGVNGTWLASGDPASGTNPSSSSISTTTAYCAAVSDNTVSGTFTVNFGQLPFAYAAPSGYKSLCTTNLPDPAIADGSQYFDAVAYPGTSGTQTITVDFAPDFAWLKRRDGIGNNLLFDKLRLTGSLPNRLFSNLTNKESTSADGQNSFSSTGIVLDGSGGGGDINTSGRTYVAWQWKAGGTGVSNTAGTIPSTVSANPTAGFSVLTYTGNGTAGATVGHGLSVAPSFLVVKNRDTDGEQWVVYHKTLGGTKYLKLSDTSGEGTSIIVWNNTDPTDSVITLGNWSAVNQDTKSHVCYAFVPVEGYSAFGSYGGSASKTFVYTGFRPALVILKKSTEASTSYGWPVVDKSRPNGYNDTVELWADQAVAEATSSSYNIDLLSNGFCINAGGNTNVNEANKTYIYAAFAENPFKYSLAR